MFCRFLFFVVFLFFFFQNYLIYQEIELILKKKKNWHESHNKFYHNQIDLNKK